MGSGPERLLKSRVIYDQYIQFKFFKVASFMIDQFKNLKVAFKSRVMTLLTDCIIIII